MTTQTKTAAPDAAQTTHDKILKAQRKRIARTLLKRRRFKSHQFK